MFRNISFYMAVCCGALALANLVWASQPGSKSGPPMPPGKSSSSGPTYKAPMDSKMPTIDPKVITKVDAKVITKIDVKPTGPLVLTKPSNLDKLPVTPAIKLTKDMKFDATELTKIKPPIDLSKISGDKLVKMKPPVDFKVKTTDLSKIHIPTDAVMVAKLNAKFDFKGQQFILNKDAYKGMDYHLKHGVKCAWGWCYPGQHHCHWHHCIWDPSCGCYYYYDPCCSCYYYWCQTDVCYYPCWWFVNYCDTYYPWWVCGGFETYGYHCLPHHRFTIRIGW